MIGRIEYLHEFKAVIHGGYLNFGKNANGIIQGDGVLTNGNFSI